MSADGKVRVLIVEDSPVVQRLLEHVLGRDRRLTVVGKAGDAAEAMRLIRLLEPDVVTMDIRLPGMNGFEATRRIMQEYPLPIVVVASNVDDASLDISMSALRAGALSVVEKPTGLGRADYEAVAERLCTQVAIMSQVRVVRQRAPALKPVPAPPPLLARTGPYSIVGIVASTGGPGALARILGALPMRFALPVAIVQHIGAPFVAGFAQWLGTISMLPVAMAEQGQRPQPGHVHVAPGGVHLTLVDGVFVLDHGQPVHGQQPSGDVLFESMASSRGGASIGVLLTGMGEDGARGLLSLRRAGGYTLAEDSSTAVVWGMPGAAVRLGAAVEQLPVDAIARRLADLALHSEVTHG